MDRVAYPKKLTVVLTDRCNLKCFICMRDEYETAKSSKGTHVDFEHLRQLEPALRHAETISLTGFGESFLYPRLHDTLDYIYALNPRDNLIAMISNGTALSYEHGRKLSGRLRELVISLNAANPAAYQRDMHPEVNRRDFAGDLDPRVRLEPLDGAGLSQFAKTCGKIREFLRGLGPAEARKVRLHYVVHRDNIAEMSDFVLVAKELGCSTVGFYHYLVTQESRIDYAVYFHQQVYNDAYERARALGRSIGVKVDGTNFGLKAPQDYDKEQHCSSPFDEAIVQTNGAVMPCCHIGAGDVGNAFQVGFEAVWFGQQYRMLRDERYLDGCQTCNQYRTLDDVDLHFHPAVKASERYKQIFADMTRERPSPLKLLVIGAGADGSRSLWSTITELLKVNDLAARVHHDSDSYSVATAVMQYLATKDASLADKVLAAWRNDVVVGNNFGFIMPLIRAAFGPGLKIIHLKRSRDAGVRGLVNHAALYPQNWGGYTTLQGAHDIVRPTARHFREMTAEQWAGLDLAGRIAWYYDKNHALIEAARPDFDHWLEVGTEELSDPATVARIARFIDPRCQVMVEPAHLNASSIFEIAKVADPYERIWLARLLSGFDINQALASDSYPIAHFVHTLRMGAVGRVRSAPAAATRLKAVYRQVHAWIDAARRGDASALPALSNATVFRRIRGVRLEPERQIRLERMLAGFDVQRLARDDSYAATFFVERLIAPHVGDPAMYPLLVEALQPIVDQLRDFILQLDRRAFADEAPVLNAA